MFPAPDSRPAADPNAASDLVRDGVVTSVSFSPPGCEVDLGDGLVIGPIPWTAMRAGALRIWTPPAVGEQVQVIAPEGDFERARVSQSLFCDAFPPPASDGSTRIEWSDGCWIGYDLAGTLDLNVPQLVRINAPKSEITGDVEITGQVTITGDIELDGKLEATGDVVSDTISLQEHVHQQPASPAVMTGAPKP